MAKDPVCGMEVDVRDAKHRASFQNQTYYFCSRECKDSFEEAPEDYLVSELFDDEDLGRTGT